MPRPIHLFTFVVLMFTSLQLAAQNWQPYPEHLPQFSFSDQQLAEQWSSLTGDLRGPLPTADALLADAQRWPDAYQQTAKLLKQKAGEDERFAVFSEGLEGQEAAYAYLVRQAWRLLFEGRFQEARDLGLSLGPAGYFPGLYAQALQASLIEADAKRREALLQDVIDKTAAILPLAPEHPMIRFGNAYGKARILDDLSRSAAMGTGYTSEVKEQLEQLIAENGRDVYAITLLGGVHAGIIDKAGKMLGRMTFGARENTMNEMFERALELNPHYPGLYLEYARALEKVEGRSARRQIRQLLEAGAALPARSAEEALLVDASQRMLADW
ncbi:MAG: hypothetical protein LAT63_15735 [Marinobacter sp.]|nr:hypothetical protein [Marinobacter sp.]